MTVETRISAFLDAEDWGDAQCNWLRGDASARRYARLIRPDEGAILMHDPEGAAGSLPVFLRLARWLRDAGISAPRVMADALPDGLALLEDLGPESFATWLLQHPEEERALYSAAADLLVQVQTVPPPLGLTPMTAETLTQMIVPVFDEYAPGLPERDALTAELGALMAQVIPAPSVIVLRDFHAENLIWRPEQQGLARIGVLDFQDATLGHPAYDLVSLLRDARRDLAPGTEEAVLQHIGADAAFRAAYDLLGLQRNLRILGIFARLARQGKASYLALMPRVHGHLARSTATPEIAAVTRAFLAALPRPEVP